MSVPDDPTWPAGMRCAAAFTFDFDVEEAFLGEDPANADRPGALSQGTYGAKWGVPLVLELLARHGIRATFYWTGHAAETNPEVVRRVRDAGHETGCHGLYPETLGIRSSPCRITGPFCLRRWKAGYASLLGSCGRPAASNR